MGQRPLGLYPEPALRCQGLDRDDVESGLTPSDINTLAVVSEQVKRDLTNRARTRARVMAESVSGTIEVTRGDFEEATRHLLTLTTDCCEEALREAGLTWNRLDGYILVGGSTKMPQVREYLTGKVGSGPSAATSTPTRPWPWAPPCTRPEVRHRVLASRRFCRRPALLAGRPPQAGGLHGALHGHDRGERARSRYVNSTIIGKNTPVPATNSREYAVRATPGRPGSLEIYLLQGDDPAPLNNTVVGKYVVPKIPGERGRETHVKVSYSYTENATIEVGATLASSGRALEVERAEVESDLSRFLNAPTDNDAEGGPWPVDARVMICVDVSACMYGEGFAAAEEAVDSFLDSVDGSGVQVGLMYFAESSKVVCEPSDDYAAIVKYTRAGLCNRCVVNPDLLKSPDFNYQEFKLSEKSGFYSLEATECGLDPRADPLNEYISWRGGVKKDDMSDIVLILTNGCWVPYVGDSALNNSKSLKEDGVTIIGIGVPSVHLEPLYETEYLKLPSRRSLPPIATRAFFDFSELSTAFSSIGRSISSGSGISI